MEEKLVYELDNILNGSRGFNKLKDIYLNLKEFLIPFEPIQKSTPNTVTINDYERGLHYCWELYNVKDSFLMIEFYGNWNGYANESSIAPSPDSNSAYLSGMRLTIHNPNIIIRDDLEEILEKYPRKKQE